MGSGKGAGWNGLAGWVLTSAQPGEGSYEDGTPPPSPPLPLALVQATWAATGL